MIPKKIHYVWFGDKDFGEIEKKCMETWHKVLPEYEIVRWGNDCIDKFDNRMRLRRITSVCMRCTTRAEFIWIPMKR